MKEALFEKLQDLSAIPGAPGFEGEVLQELQNRMEPLVDRIEADNMGNIFAYKSGDRPGPRLMVAAHADQIGAMVKYIDADGYIKFEKLGGILDSLITGRKVLVKGHLGVVGTKAGHYQTAEDRTKVTPSEELYIDVGADSREGVHELGISIGDPITYLSPVERFTNADRVCGGAVDDRLGCAVLLQLLEDLQETEFAGELVAVITVQEEVGLRGATVASFRINPDIMLALDTIPAGGTPDVKPELINTGIGKGPIFAVMSGRGGRGMITHPRVKELLVRSAEEEGQPYQLMVFPAGNNDATAAHLVREGIPSASITLPRRYSHSPVEVADLNDAVAAVNILAGVIKRMDAADLSFF